MRGSFSPYLPCFRGIFLSIKPKISNSSKRGYQTPIDSPVWKVLLDARERAVFTGGYGRMSWIEATDWLGAAPDPVAGYAEDIIRHMNDDHSEAMVACCRAFTKATDTTTAMMTGVDRYGFEMSATTAAGPRPIRLAFSREVSTPQDARRELVALARRARETTR